jgi:polygalacturonase
MASGLRFIGGTSSGGAGGASASVAAGFGNGSTDATAAIQAAVDSLGTKGGDVFIPAGVYMVSTSIVVPGGVMLRGSAME